MIPTDCLIHALSFLSAQDQAQFSKASKACQTAVQATHLIHDYPTIRSFGPDTYIHRLVEGQALQTEEERLALVKRVYYNAVGFISAHKQAFTEEDALRHIPVIEMSYPQLNAAAECIQMNLKDQALVILFLGCLSQIPLHLHPRLPGNLRANATFIRTWMNDNQNIIDGVTSLNLTDWRLTQLPEEIHQFRNLEELDFSNTLLTTLPDNFNPPRLRKLRCYQTPLIALPDDFNPPRLRELNLSYSHIVTLPDNFSPPKLRVLKLKNTLLTALPRNFNPEALRVLNLQGTLVSRLPGTFNSLFLRELNISNTPFGALPDHFCPRWLKMLNIRDTLISALPPHFRPSRNCQLHLEDTQIPPSQRRELESHYRFPQW